MASTSASSVQKSFKYDVFLSFRGEDTRKNFVDHLYSALQRKSITTYKDDEEINKGKRISDELMRSIMDSKFYIIILSKNYASSSWCLDELVKIMECQKTNEHTAYPVFYDVEPTEVRKQSGIVGEAFSKHTEEEAEKWRSALREVANLAGWELKNTFDGHEGKLIKKIVEDISLELRSINSSIDEKLVGMETRAKDVVSSLEIGIDDVRIIGIKGMGGAGKTTLARTVFDQISFQFESSSFVENVREISKNPLCGLKSLQKQILSNVTNDQHITINSVHEGKRMMKKMMCVRKVLVVLDDVDRMDQLEALAGELNWFKPGSRVIITTREEQVLVAHGVPKNLILNASLLSPMEANSLFNRYAFGSLIPNQGYENLSSQFLRYAAGLPLTIKVLGSFLRGQNELKWVGALDRLKTIPLKETMDILRLSFDSLEDDYKEIFLDVACLLKGWNKESAIIALECRGFHAINGLRVLEQKSLISIVSRGSFNYYSDQEKFRIEQLDMHDHIEEMGKNIVLRFQPDESYKHSRLWIGEEINDILAQDNGTEAVRCLKVYPGNALMLMKGLRKLKKLCFLYVISEANLDCNGSLYQPNSLRYSRYLRSLSYLDYTDSLYLPNSLQYLQWDYYPFTCLPKNFQANNLVGLKMHHTNIIQLWGNGERKELKKLRFLDLRFCKLKTLDIGLIPNLESLVLVGCGELIEIRMPFECLKLKQLRLESCFQLEPPLDLTRAQNLETLEVKKCNELKDLGMPFEFLKLKHLSLQCGKLKTLNIPQSKDLDSLIVKECYELDMPFEYLKLKHLDLQCFKLKSFNLGLAENLETLKLELSPPHTYNEIFKMKSLAKLKYLRLQRCKEKTLNLTNAQKLERLELSECEDLKELHLPVESSELKTVEVSCSKLRTLNLSETRNLKVLKLDKCEDLEELRMPVKSPELETVEVSCSNLRTLNLSKTRNLKVLKLYKCEDLVELRMAIESPKLNLISISCSKLGTLKLGLSPHLEFLHLLDCFTLEEVSIPVGCLSCHVRFRPFGSSAELHLIARSFGICPLHPDNHLPKFRFECVYKDLLESFNKNFRKLISFGLYDCTNLASLLKSICNLQHLRKLTLQGDIPEVPKEIEQLECLEELTLLSTNIEHLPDIISSLQHLKVLQLKSCSLLKKLPEDIGRLECLEELCVTDCISLQDIPNNICEMKRLKYLHLTNCILVEKLPEKIGRLKCLKELNIQGTSIIDPPESIFELEDLLFLL